MRWLILLTLLFATAPNLTWAQISGPTDFSNLVTNQTATEVFLEFQPEFPEPGSTFTVRVNDYALVEQAIGYRWYIDGKILPEATNRRLQTFTAVEANQEMKIEVGIITAGGRETRFSRTLKPMHLDIIIEPQTRIPAFYRGRALPSAFSTVNAVALVNGGEVDPRNLSFTWNLDNKVLEDGVIFGRPTVSFKMPQGQAAILSVTISDRSGMSLARKVWQIPVLEPRLFFYEINPSLGLKPRRLTSPTHIIGPVLNLRAEPFYLDLNTFNNPDHLEWKLDGQPIELAGGNPYDLTLSPTPGTRGTSRLELHVRNLTQLLQGVKGQIMITN